MVHIGRNFRKWLIRKDLTYLSSYAAEAGDSISGALGAAAPPGRDRLQQLQAVETCSTVWKLRWGGGVQVSESARSS